MRFTIITLGCKVNQVESAAMERELISRGHTLTDSNDEIPADVCIINTCTVTAVSDKKSRTAVRRAKKLNPNAFIAVCGCFARTSPEQAALLGADIIAGRDIGLMEFLTRLESAYNEDTKNNNPAVLQSEHEPQSFELLQGGGLTGRTRAMLKIQDGCNNYCTYCIIPYARGRSRSMPLDMISAEAVRLYNQNYRELVLTGIEIASYGLDLPVKSKLHHAVSAAAAAAPDMRIRLGSLEPRIITPEFCQTLSQYPNICPHFHLSLQSGSDSVLKRMRRHYNTLRFYESVSLLRRFFPDCALTTDLIVGFPGETDTEFQQSLDFITKCEFARMHIFPYSQRKGTIAAAMEGQLSADVKTRRASLAQDIASQMQRQYAERFIGRVLPVLFESYSEDSGTYSGHTPNYLEITVESDTDLQSLVRNVKILNYLQNDRLTGFVNISSHIQP